MQQSNYVNAEELLLAINQVFRRFFQVNSTKELSLEAWRWSSAIMNPQGRTSWGFLKIFCTMSPNRKSSENSSHLCLSVYLSILLDCMLFEQKSVRKKKISKQFLKFSKSEFQLKIVIWSHRVFWHNLHKLVLIYIACWIRCFSLILN